MKLRNVFSGVLLTIRQPVSANTAGSKCTMAAAAAAAAACARRAHPACLNQEGGGGGGVDGEEAWPGEGVDGPAHAGPKAARLPPVGGEHREGSGM